jgi:CHAT domain-containing protein
MKNRNFLSYTFTLILGTITIFTSHSFQLSAETLGTNNPSKQLSKLQEIERRKQNLKLADNIEEGYAEIALADLYFEVEKYREAITHYKRGINKRIKWSIFFEQSVAKEGGNPTSKELNAIAQQVEDGLVFSQERMKLGYALLRIGSLTEAEEEFLKALKDLETTVESGEFAIRSVSLEPIPVGGSALIDKHRQLYEGLQELRILQKRYDEALEFAERGRTLGLSALTSISDDPFKVFQIQETKIENLEALAKEQNVTFIEYSIIGNKNLYIYVIQPDGQLHFRQVDLTNFSKQLLTAQKENWALTGMLPILFFSSTLYVWRRNMLFVMLGVFIITTSCTFQKSRTHPKACFSSSSSFSLRGYIESAYVTVRGEVGDESVSTTQASNRVEDCLAQQYELLIQPIQDFLPQNPKNHIVFIPDRDLFRVPFTALKTPDGHYLIEKHTIRVSPSIQTLQRLQQVSSERSVATTSALVVGNPTLPKQLQQLGALPNALEEAKVIAQVLETKPLLEQEATETTVVKQISKARIIHLATHGKLNHKFRDVRQLTSAPSANTDVFRYDVFRYKENLRSELDRGIAIIALAPSKKDDGLLNEIELYSLPFKAELVVLSACETGLGKITSDGVVGLARPFLASGVPTVIASLWQIPDAPTAELMTSFYKNIHFKSDRAQALRQAMLETMKRYPNDPRMWAGFSLIGMGQTPLTISPEISDTTLTNALTIKQLRNAEYTIPDVGTFKLKDGMYEKNDRHPTQGYRDYLNIRLGDTIVIGDLNRDGDKDAVVSLAYNGGGSGLFTEISIVLNKNGSPVNVHTESFGDDVSISNVEIKAGGQIEVTYTIGSPGTSVRKVETYVLLNEKLKRVQQD